MVTLKASLFGRILSQQEGGEMLNSMTLAEFNSETNGGTIQGSTRYTLVCLEDAPYTVVWDGAVWRWFCGSTLVTPPALAGFTWDNQGSANASAANGGIYLSVPAQAASEVHGLYKAAPPTPYAVTALIVPISLEVNYHRYGLVFRQSADGKMHAYTFSQGGHQFLHEKWTSSTVYNSAYGNVSDYARPGQPIWMRIADDGSNRISSFSVDGWHWMETHSIGRTDFLTADQVGFFVSPTNPSYGLGVHVLSWAAG